MSDNMEAAFEKYRAKKFGAWSSYPIEAFTHFCAGWKAAHSGESAESDRPTIENADGTTIS